VADTDRVANLEDGYNAAAVDGRSRTEILEGHLAGLIRAVDTDQPVRAEDVERSASVDFGRHFVCSNPYEREFIERRGVRTMATAAIFHYLNEGMMAGRLQELRSQTADGGDVFYNDNLSRWCRDIDPDPKDAFLNLFRGWIYESLENLRREEKYRPLFDLYARAHERYFTSIHSAIEANGGERPRFIPSHKTTPFSIERRSPMEVLALSIEETSEVTGELMAAFHAAYRETVEETLILDELTYNEYAGLVPNMEPELFDEERAGEAENGSYSRIVMSFLGNICIAQAHKLVPLASISTAVLDKVLDMAEILRAGRFCPYGTLVAAEDKFSKIAPAILKEGGWAPPAYCGGMLEVDASPIAQEFISALQDFSLDDDDERYELDTYMERHKVVYPYILLGALAARLTIFRYGKVGKAKKAKESEEELPAKGAVYAGV
jgi:hypothetical protein